MVAKMGKHETKYIICFTPTEIKPEIEDHRVVEFDPTTNKYFFTLSESQLKYFEILIFHIVHIPTTEGEDKKAIEIFVWTREQRFFQPMM